MKLMTKVRRFMRWWKVHLGILLGSLAGVFMAWPDAARMAWESLPADLRSAIPPQYTPLIAIGIFLLTMIAKTVRKKQGKDDAQP